MKIWNEISVNKKSKVIVEDYYNDDEYDFNLLYFDQNRGFTLIPTR